MTISDFLKLPDFSDLKLIAGTNGLYREINNVTVVDTPDGANWLSGGELVITTAYMLKDNRNQLYDFILVLVRMGASGLGIKKNRYLREITNDALQLADSLNFPLIEIPEHYPFVGIINPVLTQMLDQKSRQLEHINNIHHEFMTLAVNNRTIPDILHTLHLIIGLPCAFADTYLGNVYVSDHNGPFNKESIHDSLSDESFLNLYDYYEVTNHTDRFGYLLFEKGSLAIADRPMQQTALQYSGIVLILRMQILISNMQTAEKYRDSFIEDLLLQNVKTDVEIQNRARLYNWDFSNGGVSAVVDINNIKKHFTDDLDYNTNQILENATELIFKSSITEIQQEFPDAKYFKQSDFIVFIISESVSKRSGIDERLSDTFQRLQTQLTDVSPFTITLGVGQYYDNIRDISKSYAEARSAINLGYSLSWFNTILFYNRLGLYRLLAPIRNTPEGNELHSTYIQPLIAYDKQYHSELLSTLDMIIRCGWNLKETAASMYLHYNSIKYRYGKICKVLGIDLSTPENRSLMDVAFKVYQLSSSYKAF